MHKHASILGLFAAALAGCVAKPKAPPVVYNPVDVIASGKPPLAFSVDRPGGMTVIDVTTQSRVYYFEDANEAVTRERLLRLDPERKALTIRRTPATQPSDVDELLPIDPDHIYAVEFAPSFKTTPPATMPAGK